MSKDSVIYSPRMSTRELLDLHKSGITVQCYHCGTALVFALSHESGAQHNVHPGIYCPKASEHLSILVDARPRQSFWDQFESSNDVERREELG